MEVKKICKVGNADKTVKDIAVYNSMVIGMQNYYRIATNVANDFR